MAGMKPSLTPAASIAAFRLAMSTLSASMPWYVIGPDALHRRRRFADARAAALGEVALVVLRKRPHFFGAAHHDLHRLTLRQLEAAQTLPYVGIEPQLALLAVRDDVDAQPLLRRDARPAPPR